MANREQVLVLDFGSQYTQLIARRIRELGMYCRIVPGSISPAEVHRVRPPGLVLSGRPASILDCGHYAIADGKQHLRRRGVHVRT